MVTRYDAQHDVQILLNKNNDTKKETKKTDFKSETEKKKKTNAV
tara:strand:- start:2942 stop:3073 length:132 start_codon:yes stop_codon:yes gene_type:complete